MDGHFVPPITFGALVVGALADQVHDAGGIIDVHLMIERPERYVGDFASAGADNITIHVEATPHVHYTLQAIREAGCTAGAAIYPAHPGAGLDEVAPTIARPGALHERQPRLGRQQFIPWSLDKLRADARAAARSGRARGRRRRARARPRRPCVEAGANLLVTGSAVFGSDDPAAAYAAIAAAAGARRPEAASSRGGRRPSASCTAAPSPRSSRPRPWSPRRDQVLSHERTNRPAAISHAPAAQRARPRASAA